MQSRSLDNIDTFSEELRRYNHGSLMPTSHGDHLDRAMKSLAKELGVPVSVELVNTQAVKVFFVRVPLYRVEGHYDHCQGFQRV